MLYIIYINSMKNKKLQSHLEHRKSATNSKMDGQIMTDIPSYTNRETLDDHMFSND